MRYTQDIPGDADQVRVDVAIEHVRAHLAGAAAADDDPATYADAVQVRTEERSGRIYVIGELDAEPVADYLRADFTPDQDAERNPLSVPSYDGPGIGRPNLSGGTR